MHFRTVGGAKMYCRTVGDKIRTFYSCLRREVLPLSFSDQKVLPVSPSDQSEIPHS
jgi:hypothetical protein